MNKRKFKKMLRKEKNPVFSNRRLFWIVLIFLLVAIIAIFAKWEENNDAFIQPEVMTIQLIILVCSVLPGCIVDIITDIRISKMYKLYKEGQEYNNSQKIIKKPIVISLVIISMFFAFEFVDFSNARNGKNKPLLSVQDNLSSNKYKKKYKSLLYDYYVGNDNLIYLNKKNSKFENYYADRINTLDYIDNFNKNLKEANIDKELDFYDYIYMDGYFIWILEENLELRIQIEGDNIRDPEEENVIDAAIFSFGGDLKEFEKYSKILIKTNYDYYTSEEISEIYSKINYQETIESEGTGYKLYKINNANIFGSKRYLENENKSYDYYLHVAIDNSIYIKLPNSYEGIENEEEGYSINCIEKETESQIIAKYYLKDYEETFYMTADDAINEMEEECNKKFTEINKLNESNNIKTDDKVITEKTYSAKYNGKRIKYKISAFNMGGSDEYIISTCEIINEDLYDTKINELDSIRNSTQIYSEGIAIGFKVKNDEAIYDKKNIEGIFTINVPKSFSELNEEGKNKIYINSIPNIAYMNSDFTVSMAIKITDIPNGVEYDIDKITEDMAVAAYQEGGFLGTEVRNIKGNKIGEVKTMIETGDVKTYNHIMQFITNRKYIVINFSAKRDLMSKWNWVGDEILESIQF